MVDRMRFANGQYGEHGGELMTGGKGEKRKEGRLSWKWMLGKRKKKSDGRGQGRGNGNGNGDGEVFDGVDARGEWVSTNSRGSSR